ncbi:MAG: cysteine dioxygenase family protein [Chromatiales bacterium]|jgi:predicted metal-dependent enzyme (double-stranded beta helix superfamily)|nr:cysteine dioxygenase family protein [Chromatiales bacterium]
MDVHDLVSAFSGAARADDPMAAARDVVNELSSDLDGVADAISYLTGTGGNALQAFYRAPDLSLLKVSFPAGRRTPPHNHGTWAMILVLSGQEKNTLYRRDEDGSLRRVSEVVLSRGSILPMRADAVHVAECIGDEPAVGLHVYGANVLGTDRQMWDPVTLEQHPLDWSYYEGFAQRASAAAGAPLS